MRNRHMSGFTLVELMIVVVIVGIIGAIFVGTCAGPVTSTEIERRAMEDARIYARTMHPRWQNVNVMCQGVDTDHDGYVSCTVGDGNEVDAIDCRASMIFDYARGCRQQRFGMRYGR